MLAETVELTMQPSAWPVVESVVGKFVLIYSPVMGAVVDSVLASIIDVGVGTVAEPIGELIVKQIEELGVLVWMRLLPSIRVETRKR